MNLETDSCIEFSKYSEYLHCSSVKIFGDHSCYEIITPGEFSRKLFCGTIEISKKFNTMVTIF